MNRVDCGAKKETSVLMKETEGKPFAVPLLLI